MNFNDSILQLRSALAHATANAWRAQCTPVQWLARISAILASERYVSIEAQATLTADVVFDALLVGALPSLHIAQFVEYGIACGAICIDTTMIRFAQSLEHATADRVPVLLDVLQRVTPALGRVRESKSNNSNGDDDVSVSNSISALYVERCRSLGALILALLRCASNNAAAAASSDAVMLLIQQLTNERPVIFVLAAGAQLIVPDAYDALLKVLPADSTLRRLWTVRDDDEFIDTANGAKKPISIWQPLTGRVALGELMPCTAQSAVITTPVSLWRSASPPISLAYVLDRLMCRIVATDEVPVELIAREVDAAHAISLLPLLTFQCFLIDRLLENYHKSTVAHILAMVLDVIEAACSISPLHLQSFYSAACDIFVTAPPGVDVQDVTWPIVHAFALREVAQIGASCSSAGRFAQAAQPPGDFAPTKDWFGAASSAIEHGVPLDARVISHWLSWLEADNVRHLSFDDARAAQMSLLTCVAADSAQRCQVADAIVREVRAAVDVSYTSTGIMLALLANAPADTPLYEMLRQSFRLRHLVDALVVVCTALGNETGVSNGGDSVMDMSNGNDGQFKRRHVEPSLIWVRFSDAFLLLYRLNARGADDSLAGAFTLVRGVERWNAAFLGTATQYDSFDMTRMSIAVWARATSFHMPVWDVKEGVVEASAVAALNNIAPMVTSYLLQNSELLPQLSSWAMLLSVPKVMENCLVQLAAGAFDVGWVTTRIDQLCQRCPCLFPAVISWLADAALLRTKQWVPYAPDAATEAPHDAYGRSVPNASNSAQQLPLVPQIRMLGELYVNAGPTLNAAATVLSTSPSGALIRRVSVSCPWKQILRARHRLDELQSHAIGIACGRRGLTPAQSVIAAKATAGMDPCVIRLFNKWFFARADTGARWVRVGWVGDVLISCRAVVRGTSARIMADWLATELYKNAVSSQFTTRQQAMWFADFTGCVMSNLPLDALLEWIDVASPALIDRCPGAALTLVARAMVVACVLADCDSRDAPATACVALARLVAGVLIAMPTVDGGMVWAANFPTSNRDQVGRALVSEFALGGTRGPLAYCDAKTRQLLMRTALAAHLDVVTVCRLFAACDSISNVAASPDAILHRTYTLIHCLQ